MINDRFLVGIALFIWLLGYLNPGETSDTPFRQFNTYIQLPLGLNGILRRMHSSKVPAGVVSVPALTAQIGSFLMTLLYFAYQGGFIKLENHFAQVYGYLICYLLGAIISMVIRKIRPFNKTF